jgi:short subunit dehydrogenase-like uncharacterized protein
MSNVVVYGAYGYTGELIVKELLALGVRPILSGRNESKLRAMASDLDLPFKTVSLDNLSALKDLLENVSLVVHAAGPFSATAKPMIKACLLTKTHYIDITGEWEVYEYAQSKSEEAIRQGVMLLPGAGFDVVPSDCLAMYLKKQLPDATHLTLAFTSKKASPSRGTAKTMIEGAHQGQMYRKDHVLKSKPLGKSKKTIDFGEFQQECVGISWGDISSGYYSTKIPNIEVFMGASSGQIKKLQWLNAFKLLLKWSWVQKVLKKQVDKRPAGPDEERRNKGRAWFWGQISNGNKVIEACLQTSEGYTLTAHSASLIARHILEGHFKKGYQTPASAFGHEFVTELPGTGSFT